MVSIPAGSPTRCGRVRDSTELSAARHSHSSSVGRPPTTGPPAATHAASFDRITVNPDLMGGAPTIRGLRVPVATVVSMIADGMTVDEICTDLPDLAPADVAEALHYATETVRERRLPLRTPA